MHDDMIKIGGIIRAAREANGVTQKALSASAGIAVRTIIDIEKDKHYPTFEVLYSILRILNIPADNIFRPEKAGFTPEQEQLMMALQSCGDREQAVFMQTAWAYIRAARNDRDNVKPN